MEMALIVLCTLNLHSSVLLWSCEFTKSVLFGLVLCGFFKSVFLLPCSGMKLQNIFGQECHEGNTGNISKNMGIVLLQQKQLTGFMNYSGIIIILVRKLLGNRLFNY